MAQQEVHEQLLALTVEGHAFIERVLQRLCQLGLLHVEQSDLLCWRRISGSITRYWIDYCQTRSGQRQITEQDVQQGIQQVRALVAPYLTPLEKVSNVE